MREKNEPAGSEARRRYIEQEPWGPDNPGAARLRGSLVHVWALVGPVRGYNADIRRVAKEFDLPVKAVRAAMVYYNEHREEVDAEIARVT